MPMKIQKSIQNSLLVRHCPNNGSPRLIFISAVRLRSDSAKNPASGFAERADCSDIEREGCYHDPAKLCRDSNARSSLEYGQGCTRKKQEGKRPDGWLDKYL